MKYFVGILYFALALLLNSIEISSLTTLKELFPASESSALPPLRKFKYETDHQFINLRRIVHGKVIGFDARSTFYARAHIIIGWQFKDIIKPLTDLSGETNYVFDTRTNSFVSLTFKNLNKLGVNRRERFVFADDKAASRKASLQANYQENDQLRQETTHDANDQLKHPASHQPNYPTNDHLNYQENLHPDHHLFYLSTHEANHEIEHQEDNLSLQK